MLGAAHAAANPLTAQFDVVHGEAVGVMMPQVLEGNLEHPPSREIYGRLANEIQLQPENLPNWFRHQLRLASMPESLRHWKITPEDIPTLATAAAQQWTGTFNPIPVNAGDFRGLYERTREP